MMLPPKDYLSGRLFIKKISNKFIYLRFVNLSSNDDTILVNNGLLRFTVEELTETEQKAKAYDILMGVAE